MENAQDIIKQISYIKYQLDAIVDCVERPDFLKSNNDLNFFILSKVVALYKGKYGENYPSCYSERMVVKRKYVELCHIFGVQPTDLDFKLI